MSYNLDNVINIDTHKWLENIEEKTSLDWVAKQNVNTEKSLCSHHNYPNIYKHCEDLFSSEDKILGHRVFGEYYYSLYTDKNNPSGIVRRRPINQSTIEWESLFDIDSHNKEQGTKYSYHGVLPLLPKNQRALIYLSIGGKDAHVIKELDLNSKTLVKDGFNIPEAKSVAKWINKNTLILSADFGPESLTNSGYPRTIRILKRGQELSEAVEILSVPKEYNLVMPMVFTSEIESKILIYSSINYEESEVYIYDPSSFESNNIEASITKIEKPPKLKLYAYQNNKIFLYSREDQTLQKTNFKAGGLYACELGEDGSLENMNSLFEPTDKEFFSDMAISKNKILVSTLNNVKGQIHIHNIGPGHKREDTLSSKTESFKLYSSCSFSNEVCFIKKGFLNPTEVLAFDIETTYENKFDLNNLRSLSKEPDWFTSKNFKVEQHWSKSPDGTPVPYFVVCHKNLKYNGKNPCIVYAYGGFEISVEPFYLKNFGKEWLEKGGVYIVANIRGGNEFGPKWHQSALKENRQIAFDDFISILEDVCEKKLSSPNKIGISGGSNGGLLVATVMTQRPDLMKAVLCGVPLTDMLNYHKMLVGSHWISEYGNPDIPEERAYLMRYSPYHNIHKEMWYPKAFFYTSTYDDRVHPGHARKMVAKLDKLGHESFYFESLEGGHSMASNTKAQAKLLSLELTYLQQLLFDS